MVAESAASVPDLPEQLGAEAPDLTDQQPEIGEAGLSSWEKLRILAELDPRAGFLPLSHGEKNWGVTLLDVLATDDKTSRVALYLNTIFLRRRRETIIELNAPPKNDQLFELASTPLNPAEIETRARNAGREAVISVAGEFIDYYRSSVERHDTLKEMREASKDMFPGLVLAGAFPSEAIDMLIQYRDLKDLLKSGYPNSLLEFDPLAGTEDRSEQESIGEIIKNKVVTSVYPLARRSEELAAHLKVQAESLTIKDIRLDLAAAIENEVARQRFWLRVLREAIGHGAAAIVIKRELRDSGLALR